MYEKEGYVMIEEVDYTPQRQRGYLYMRRPSKSIDETANRTDMVIVVVFIRTRRIIGQARRPEWPTFVVCVCVPNKIQSALTETVGSMYYSP